MNPFNPLINPLSPFTYYRRHKGQALLLLALIGLLTLGVFVTVGMLSAIIRGNLDRYNYLSGVSHILAGQTLDSGTAAQLRAHPDVAAVLPENGLTINLPWFSAGYDSRPVLGVTGDDLELVLETCNLRLKEGHLIEPRAAEIVLSEEIVRALGLQIGDVIGHDIDEDLYPTIATELTLVGTLESTSSEGNPDIQTGFVSYEYLEGHEAYQPRLSNLLVIPRQGRRAAVNDFAEPLIDGIEAAPSARLETFERYTEGFREVVWIPNGIFLSTAVVVAVSAALTVGMVNRIAIAQRLPELGLLHAAGYEKQSLIRRLVLEIAVVTGIGWGSSLLFSVAISALLNTTPLAAARSVIDLTNPVVFLSTLPTPLAVVSWVTVSVNRVLSQLDAVAIVERGKLSMEQPGGKRRARAGLSREVRSSHNPLSSRIFYLRHRRRSLALLASTGLMVLGVAFPAFMSLTLVDSYLPAILSYSSHAGIVSPAPTYQAMDPAVLARIRTHPAVAHVIPVKSLSMAANGVMFQVQIPVYGVREGELQTLLDAYDLHVGEGEMVQPRSGQIVLTRALAQNRGLSVGDTVGRPIHELDSMPTELTVVGLLDPAAPGLVDREGYCLPPAPRWVGFASYEFVENHERYDATPIHALVLPVEGHETEAEAWLEESIGSAQITVETFGTVYRLVQKGTRETVLLFAMTEALLAAVAAGALAILNTIFVIQRRDEFGILHAAGHSRVSLIVRTLRESIGIAGAGWLMGAACCLALLLSTQAIFFEPRGLILDFFKPATWLFTLPVPIAVVAASAGTIAWTLSRLDPVAVIERR